MRTLSFLFTLLLTGTFAFAQQESDKTLVKSMNPEQCPNIKIDIQNKGMESNPWDEGTIRVELTIKANVPEAILAQLVKAGRYSIDGDKDGEIYLVQAPNLSKSIFIGGKALEEEIKINVKTPGYFALAADGTLSKDINEEVIAGRANNPEEAARVIAEMKKIKEEVKMHVNIASTSKYKGEVDLSKFKLVIDGVETTADQIKF